MYVSSATLCAGVSASDAARQGEEGASAEQFVALMDDLHRALVLKMYFSVCEADRKWSSRRAVSGGGVVRPSVGQAADGREACGRRRGGWLGRRDEAQVVQPHPAVRSDRAAARADRDARNGRDAVGEPGRPGRWRAARRTRRASSRSIQDELRHHLRPMPIDEPNEHETTGAIGAQAIETAEGGRGGYLCSDAAKR